jgi:hypothetical protein
LGTELDAGPRGVLKPLVIAELVQIVRRVLDKGTR